MTIRDLHLSQRDVAPVWDPAVKNSKFKSRLLLSGFGFTCKLNYWRGDIFSSSSAFLHIGGVAYVTGFFKFLRHLGSHISSSGVQVHAGYFRVSIIQRTDNYGLQDL